MGEFELWLDKIYEMYRIVSNHLRVLCNMGRIFLNFCLTNFENRG